MFNNPHFDRVRQLFADQFEPEGTGFLYRKNIKGAPIRVTASERDRFVASFNQRLRYGAWAILPATLLLIGSLVLLFPRADDTTENVAVGIGIALILAPFMAGYFWAWNAPARELERRPLAGEARSRTEIRRIMFAKMTYGHLGFVGASAVLFVWKVSNKNDIFHGWGRLWLVFGGVLIAIVAVQAFRKWNYERNP